MKTIYDLPRKLLGERIFTRLPIISLRAVRCTCKLWNFLTKDWVLGTTRRKHPSLGLGFIVMNYKVFLVRFNHRNLFLNQVDAIDDKLEVPLIFPCNGLLLSVVKLKDEDKSSWLRSSWLKDEDKSWLVVWNPYLGQTRSIRFRPIISSHRQYMYAFGHDINYNYKILRFVDAYMKGEDQFEIYDFSSNSWRVIEATLDCCVIEWHQRGVPVKGNAYFYGQVESEEEVVRPNLLCFDFTTERFGPRLPLPFDTKTSGGENTVTLSCIREEQLAVLYFEKSYSTLEIWVTTKIESDSLSWSKYLQMDLSALTHTGAHFLDRAGSFFIDEEEKVAVVFCVDVDSASPTRNYRYNTAFILGADGCNSVRLGEVIHGVDGCKSVRLGEAL